jgi:phosphomevalonate kinase
MAPGKLVLTGAYAVLDGAPALVVSVDRYAIADTARHTPTPSLEVRAAFGARAAPEVDVAMLQTPSGAKLGLGSSAAGLVASLGACALERGDDLSDPQVRGRLFRAAREAHARAQEGGSGVDVAASVYGGVNRYALKGEDAVVDAVEWPPGLVLAAFFTGHSVRTADFLARVATARSRSPVEASRLAQAMFDAAVEAADATRIGAERFVRSARAYAALLSNLGTLADVPIGPAACAELGEIAAAEEAAFIPSGAGGGDTAVWLGVSAPSAGFEARAEGLGFSPLTLRIDQGGVRREPLTSQRIRREPLTSQRN